MSNRLEQHIIDHLEIGLDFLEYDTSDFEVINDYLTIKDSGIDHGSISGLSDDDHVGYTLRSDWLQNGFINRTDSTLSFTNATRIFSIQPTGDSFDFFVAGVRYTSTGDTVQITNEEGVHWIYYDGDTLVSEYNPTDIELAGIFQDYAVVSIIYWDVSEAEAIYIGEERHGYKISPATHSYEHFNEGLRYRSGLGLNSILVDQSGDLDTHAQFGIDAGAVQDEDLYLVISAVGSTTGLPIFYMTGVDGDWNKYINTGFSVRTFGGTSATRLAWNEFTGGAWQLTQVTDADFVLYHVFATTDKDNPLISIMGQAEYNTLGQARDGALVEVQGLMFGYLPFPEMRPIASIIFQTDDSAYDNSVNARIRTTDDGDNYVDWRNEVISRVVVSTTDHGSLSGLIAGDDHTQYLLLAGRGGQEIDDTISITGSLGIGTSTIPHGSVGAAKFAIDGANASVSGPHIQITTATDDYPVFQQLNWSHDNISLAFDAFYDGAWKSSDAGSSFLITKLNDKLEIRYDSGIAQGGDITWNSGIALDTSGQVGIGTAAPATIFDINGDSLRIRTAQSPASNGTGIQGEIAWDANYLYVCTATNTWKRVALTGGY